MIPLLGAPQQTKLHNCHPQAQGLGQYCVPAEVQSLYLRSVSLWVPPSWSWPRGNTNLLPSSQLDFRSQAQCLTVDLCICFHLLLDEGSLITIRVVNNLITWPQGRPVQEPVPLLIILWVGVVLVDSWSFLGITFLYYPKLAVLSRFLFQCLPSLSLPTSTNLIPHVPSCSSIPSPSPYSLCLSLPRISLRNYHTDFQSGCPSLHSHQHWRSVPLTAHNLQHRLLLTFLILAILTDVRWYLRVILICISLIAKDADQLFKRIFAIWDSSAENSLFNFVPDF